LSSSSVPPPTPAIPPGLLQYLEKKEQEETFGRSQSQLANLHSALRSCVEEHEELKVLAKEEGEEMKKLVEADLDRVNETMEELVEEISELLVPAEKYDKEDAVVEVIPGAGGIEASLFAEEIFNLYLEYTQNLGFQVEVRQCEKFAAKGATAGSVGISRGEISVSGHQVFSRLKFESGVHRVQRVPATAKTDQLHTSTCSVAVLPEQRDIQVKLDSRDLKWQYMRASGAGGQGVNTADSAVRLTHIPTGTAVESQEQRSQMQNKATAMKKLQNILYQKEFNRDMSAISTDRKFQVGNMNRNEKIRTYNFSRHMVTDHRLGSSVTVGRISDWLTGQQGFSVLEKFGAELRAEEKRSKLASLLQEGSGDKSKRSRKNK